MYICIGFITSYGKNSRYNSIFKGQSDFFSAYKIVAGFWEKFVVNEDFIENREDSVTGMRKNVGIAI